MLFSLIKEGNYAHTVPQRNLEDIMLSEVKGESESHSAVSDSLGSHGLYSPWNSPAQNTGVGSLSLLQGIFPTKGSNPGLLHCWVQELSHKRRPTDRYVAEYFSNIKISTRLHLLIVLFKSCVSFLIFFSWSVVYQLFKSWKVFHWFGKVF